VVYLNGQEIFRMNMPTGAVTYATTASTVVGGPNEINRFATNISAGLLINGTNLLAVELHQSSPNTTDAAFDLQLDGIGAPSTGPITLFIANAGSEIVISWSATGVMLQEAEHLGGSWSNVISATSSPYRVAPSEVRRFYRLQKP